jgi:predicted dehydrogenase
MSGLASGAAHAVAATARKLRVGIVGGGGGFIGGVHRMAVELDGEAEVVAGALSSDAARASRYAGAWHLARSYSSSGEMARAEDGRADRIDFAIIATPNHLHLEGVQALLAAGIPVACEKPIANDLGAAGQIAAAVRAAGLPFFVTHSYTGYPAVQEAQARVAAGELGDLRRVMVEYTQGWLANPLEAKGHAGAGWRTDPVRSGAGGGAADIGTHAYNLLELVSGQKVAALCADQACFVAGRRVPDDGNMLLRMDNGARGVLSWSQVASGEDNRLVLRLYGTRAGLEWHQEEPNTLYLKPLDAPWQVIRTGGRGITSRAGLAATRLPGGHPEGYIESLGHLYRLYIADLRRYAAGQPLQGGYPALEEGLRGMQFVDAALRSSAADGQWVELP